MTTDEIFWDEEIAEWLAKTGMPAGRLGLLAAANPRAIARIKDGTARIKTLRAVLDHIRAHPAPKSQVEAIFVPDDQWIPPHAGRKVP